ncbi:hypothetical protein J3R82DRAFT_2092 [Butyriboletus roseoflavus]|nr:hypothetical protein J3R82DRAFT_2092 [Butyriboletus roseoflavus]
MRPQRFRPLTPSLSSGAPDVSTVSGVIVQVTAIVKVTVGQLNAVGSISLDGLDLTSTCSAIYALLALVLAILNSVVLIATTLTGSAIISLQGVVTGLLYGWTLFLNSSAASRSLLPLPRAVSWDPVCVVVKGSLDFLLAIFVGVQVLVGVSN